MTATYYPCYDANGNISEYLDTNGTVVAHREYDAFGNTIVATGSGAGYFNYRFSSKYWDSETGLGYWGYRYYSAGTGRCLGRDPSEEDGGVNLYVFVVNDPDDSLDVYGLTSLPNWLKNWIYNRVVNVGNIAPRFRPQHIRNERISTWRLPYTFCAMRCRS